MGDSLETSFWIMMVVQTIGSVDAPGSGARKMPSPRQYVAIVVTWLILFFVAGINASTKRAATALGWLLVLVGMVAGPFGKRAVSFINTVASNFSNNPLQNLTSVPTPQGNVPVTSHITNQPPAGVTLK